MKRKTLTLFLGLILTVGLTACGGTQEAAPAEEAAAEAVTETEAAAPEAPEAAEGGAAVETDKVPSPTVSIDRDTITITGSEPGTEVHEKGMDKVPVFSCFDIGYSTQTGPFILSINKIQVSSINISDKSIAEALGLASGQEAALIGIEFTVENTSEDDVSIYPDQSVIVTNTKEQIMADLFFSESVGGEFYGQVVKEGEVYFVCPRSSADEITHIQLRVDAPHDETMMSCGEPVAVDFELIK